MTDRLVIRMVVAILGVVAVGALVAGTLIVVSDRNVPDFIIGLGSSALGACAALLARTASDRPVVTGEAVTVDVLSPTTSSSGTSANYPDDVGGTM